MPRWERPKGRRGERPERRRIKEMGLKGASEALASKETYISEMRTPGHLHFMEKIARSRVISVNGILREITARHGSDDVSGTSPSLLDFIFLLRD